MKIYIRISIMTLLLFMQFSCNDWLELPPRAGLVREEFWKTKEDIESVVIGAYASLASMDDKLFKYGELRGDLLKADVNLGSDERNIMEGSIYSENILCKWNDFYKVINICNEIIYYAPAVQNKDNTLTDYILYGYLSEAYFLRSLSYFYLVRLYKDVPLVLEPTTTDASDVYPAKTDGDEVLSRMRADLEMAREWATVDGYLSLAENKGRATKAAIDALLADIALWTFDYESCISFIENIENLRKYKLVEMAEWFDLFYPGNSYEGIFELQYDNALNQSNKTFGLTQESARTYDPSEYAVELFDNDQEFEMVRGLGTSIRKNAEDDYTIWKYIGMASDGVTSRYGTMQNSCNWIVYRYADILLMKAEALSQLGRYQEALDILMQVRARAGFTSIPDLVNSPSSYEDAIMEERARELAFEGKRWFDLLRLGRRNNFSRKAKLVEVMIRNVPSTQKRILQIKLTNPLSWYLPIFDEELERNKNLVQNPYYNF